MESLYMVPVGVSTAIVVVHPVFLLPLERLLLGEEISLYGAPGVLDGFIGVVLFFTPWVASGVDPPGLIYSLIASLAAAAYFLIGRIVRRRGVGVASYGFPAYLSASIVASLYSLIRGYDVLGYPRETYVLFVAMAFIPMLGGHTVMNYRLGRRGASSVTSIVLGEPVGASILSYLLLGQVAAMAVIIVSLLVAEHR